MGFSLKNKKHGESGGEAALAVKPAIMFNEPNHCEYTLHFGNILAIFRSII
jgi:hypothetical protein